MSSSKTLLTSARRLTEPVPPVDLVKDAPPGSEPAQRNHRAHRKSTSAVVAGGTTHYAKPRSSLSSALGMITHKTRVATSTHQSATDTDTTLVASSPALAIHDTVDTCVEPLQKASTSLPKRVRAIGRGISQLTSQTAKAPQFLSQESQVDPLSSSTKRSNPFRPNFSGPKPSPATGRASPLSTRSASSSAASIPRNSKPSSSNTQVIHTQTLPMAPLPDTENRSPSADRSSSSSPKPRSRSNRSTQHQPNRPSTSSLPEPRTSHPSSHKARRLPPSPLSSLPAGIHLQTATSHDGEVSTSRPAKKRVDSLPRNPIVPASSLTTAISKSRGNELPQTLHNPHHTTPTQKEVKRSLSPLTSGLAAQSPGALTNNAIVAAARSSVLILEFGAEEASALADVSFGFEDHVSEGDEPIESPDGSDQGDDTIGAFRRTTPTSQAGACKAVIPAASSPHQSPPTSQSQAAACIPLSDKDPHASVPSHHPACFPEVNAYTHFPQPLTPSSTSSVNSRRFRASRALPTSQIQGENHFKSRPTPTRGRRWSRASLVSQHSTSRRLGPSRLHSNEQERGSILSWEAVVEKSREFSQSDLEDMIAKIDIGCLDGAMSPEFGTPRHSLAAASECSMEMMTQGRQADTGTLSPTLSVNSMVATPPESPCPKGPVTATRPLASGGGVTFTPHKPITGILLPPPSDAKGQNYPSLSLFSPAQPLLINGHRGNIPATIPQLRAHITALEKQLELSNFAMIQSKELASQAAYKAELAGVQQDALRQEVHELETRCGALQTEKERFIEQFDQEMTTMRGRLQKTLVERELIWQEERQILENHARGCTIRSDQVQLLALLDFERANAEIEMSSLWNNIRDEAGDQMASIDASRATLQVMLSSLSIFSQQAWEGVIEPSS